MMVACVGREGRAWVKSEEGRALFVLGRSPAPIDRAACRPTLTPPQPQLGTPPPQARWVGCGRTSVCGRERACFLLFQSGVSLFHSPASGTGRRPPALPSTTWADLSAGLAAPVVGKGGRRVRWRPPQRRGRCVRQRSVPRAARPSARPACSHASHPTQGCVCVRGAGGWRPESGQEALVVRGARGRPKKTRRPWVVCVGSAPPAARAAAEQAAGRLGTHLGDTFGRHRAGRRGEGGGRGGRRREE